MTRALLTLSIGPVHGFIAQARRVADQWAASTLLSRLVGTGIETVWAEGGEMVFPYVATGEKIPPGLPNRFVCEVDRGRVAEIARAVEGAIRGEWGRLVVRAADLWETIGPQAVYLLASVAAMLGGWAALYAPSLDRRTQPVLKESASLEA